MTMPLQKADAPPPIDRPPASLAERRTVVDFAAHGRRKLRDPVDRRLRNRIIVANALVWVAIVFGLGILLF